MGTGYTRNDVSNNIADGNIINASDLDGEFDAVESAFNSSTGHTHDGTAAEGGAITVVGPVQDLVVSATEVKPKTTNTLDLGTSALLYKDAYLQGNMYFRDTALKIVSSADGQLDIDADVELELVAPTVDIDASTAVTIDTATLTVTGSANVVGDLDVDNININGNTISSTDTNGNITLAPDGTGVVALSSTDLTFGDNDKAIFGAGSDLQIYHDGTSNIFAGNIFIDGTDASASIASPAALNLKAGDANNEYSTLRLATSADGSLAMIGAKATTTGAYPNSVGQLELAVQNGASTNTILTATATGVDVTGTVTADGLTVDGASVFNQAASDQSGGAAVKANGTAYGTNKSIHAYMGTTNNNRSLIFAENGAGSVFNVDGAGDISFYDDTGTNPSFVYDASGALIVNEDSRDFDFRVESNTNTHMLFVDGGNNRVKIGESGDYGAGVLNIDGAVYFANSSNKVIQGLTPTGFGYSQSTYGVIQLGGPNSGGTVSIGYDPSGNTSGSFTGNGIEMLFPGDIEFYQPNAADTAFVRQIRMVNTAGVIINEAGSSDVDFRVESDVNTHMLFVDGGANVVSIAQSSPVANDGALQIAAGGATDSTIGINHNDNGTISAKYSLFYQVDNTNSISGRAHVFRTGGKGYSDGTELVSFYSNEAVFNNSSNDIDFRVESNTNTHMLFIDGGTNSVGISDSSPGATKTFSDTSVTTNFFVNSNGSTNGPMFQYDDGGVFFALQNDLGSGTRYFISFGENGTRFGDVTSNGSVMTYGGTSDYRLKTNVQPMTGAIERVKALNPVTFDWISSGVRSEGFIAHELQ